MRTSVDAQSSSAATRLIVAAPIAVSTIVNKTPPWTTPCGLRWRESTSRTAPARPAETTSTTSKRNSPRGNVAGEPRESTGSAYALAVRPRHFVERVGPWPD